MTHHNPLRPRLRGFCLSVSYRVAAGSALPGFRDMSVGGNAVDHAAPGYDTVTGLGSPNADNLARVLLDAQREGIHR